MKKILTRAKKLFCIMLTALLLTLQASIFAQAAMYDEDKIASPYAAVYNVENGTFIFEKNADEIISSTATAKLMTALANRSNAIGECNVCKIITTTECGETYFFNFTIIIKCYGCQR